MIKALMKIILSKFSATDLILFIIDVIATYIKENKDKGLTWHDRDALEVIHKETKLALGNLQDLKNSFEV